MIPDDLPAWSLAATGADPVALPSDWPETLDRVYNPRPPVEFHARGIDVEVGWIGGATIRASGNSFATPHMAGMAARVPGTHPGLRPFELKTALRLSANNVKGGADAR